MSNERTISVTLTHDSTTYKPVVIGDVTVEWTRFGTPGKLKMTVLKDSTLKVENGDCVRLVVDGRNFFFGFIFIIDRKEADQLSLTAYDVLRYLKSKDIFKMPKQTYTKALKTVLKRYGLKAGAIANTKYVRKAKVFNGCVLDMLETYRKDTKNSKGVNYILYADFNKVCLKAQSSMKTDYVVTAAMASDFSYSSSIDERTYTVIKLYKGSGKKTKVYTKTSAAAKKKYGRLTYAENTKLKSKSKINKKLKTIAKAHDAPSKKLQIKNVFGVVNIRAGSGVRVEIEETGITINRSMTVGTVTHKFSAGRHTMDLTLIGGDFRE